MNEVTSQLSYVSLRDGRKLSNTEMKQMTTPLERRTSIEKRPNQRTRKISAVIPSPFETEYKLKAKRKCSLPGKSKGNMDKKFQRKRNSTEEFSTLMTRENSAEDLSDLSSNPSDIPSLTPQPEILEDLKRFNTDNTQLNINQCTYQPRYCWCTRCQIMYRLYKESDNSLNTWGNYPCFRF